MTTTKDDERASRLHRTSQLLPKSPSEIDSRLHKDASRPPIPRKKLPAPCEISAQPPYSPARPSPQLNKQLSQPPNADTNRATKLRRHKSPPHNRSSSGLPLPAASATSLAGPSTQSQVDAHRSVSSPFSTAISLAPQSDTEANSGSKLRKSWLGGKKSRSVSQDITSGNIRAWITTTAAEIEYNVDVLSRGEKVPELWNETADTLVYLFSADVGHGPQFRISSSILWSSQILFDLLQAGSAACMPRRQGFDGHPEMTVNGGRRPLAPRPIESSPYMPQSEDYSHVDGSSNFIKVDRSVQQYHLYLPLALKSAVLSSEDHQKLVGFRNLFAFLSGEPLVATRACPTNLQIFLSIATLLRQFQFTSEDGTSFGAVVDVAFDHCMKNMVQLTDCRQSRHTTIEALVLSEAMQSRSLYNEAFTHAVGKYDEIQVLGSPAFDKLSICTRNRLEKASLDLRARQRSANDRLTSFEFPSLFAGVAASTSRPEYKNVRFKNWKAGFIALRKQILSYYKSLHGQWPPKASSKKNNFVECGLNRQVLKGLYNDLCNLYDYLVDRGALTTRAYNEDGADASGMSPQTSALRKLLDEYDRSSPPVQSPIPFDVPLIPTISTVYPGYHSSSPKEQYKLSNRKLKDHETRLVLTKSHNMDVTQRNAFLDMFQAFEHLSAKNKTTDELSDQRYGYWIFLYASLQSLPLLTTDAPSLHFSDGVEYFLCQVPMGNLPWVDDLQVKMSWFGVQGGQQIVSLPSDIVNHGVEATYNRSHCWTIAQEWIDAERTSEFNREVVLSPLIPPPGFSGELGLRSSARSHQRSSSASASHRHSNNSSSPSLSISSFSRQSQRNSIVLGLEYLPMEPDAHEGLGGSSRGTSPARPSSRRGNDTAAPGTPIQAIKGTTFDDILGGMDTKQSKKKMRGF